MMSRRKPMIDALSLAVTILLLLLLLLVFVEDRAMSRMDFAANTTTPMELAEKLAAGHSLEGEVIFDLEMQIRMGREFARNRARAERYAAAYIGRKFQFTGRVLSVEWVQWRGGYSVRMARWEGIYVHAFFHRKWGCHLMVLDAGDVITVAGVGSRFLSKDAPTAGLYSVWLVDSGLRFIHGVDYAE